MTEYVLVIERGAEPGREIRLDANGPMVIGRARDAAIRLGEGDLSVSRYHAVFEVTDDGLDVRDLGGISGTAVNGVLVKQTLVRPGDAVQLGDTLVRVQPVRRPVVAAPLAIETAVTGLGLPYPNITVPPAEEKEQRALETGAIPAIAPRALQHMRCDRCGTLGPTAPDADLAGAGWLCPSCIVALRTQSPMQPKQLGEFEVLRYLAGGGMGVVYEAVHSQSSIHAAVKVLQVQSRANDVLIQRFVREQRITQALRHPNIVRCYEVGSHKGKLFLASEFVPGGDAHPLASPHSHLAEMLRVGSDLFAALAYGHNLGIVHRDVKPANVLLTRPGPDGLRRGKLADYGLAKRLNGTMSLAGGLTVKGEPGGSMYSMPPDQLEDFKNVGPAADLYGGAATVFRLLTGNVPLVLPVPMAEATFPQVASAISRRERQRLASLRPEVPAEVADLLDALVAHDSSVRDHTHASDVARVLGAWATRLVTRGA